MDKTEKVTKDKDPKRQEQNGKSHETYMKRLKEKILEDNQLSALSSTDNSTLSTSSSTSSAAVGAYTYCVSIPAILAFAVYVFFAHNEKNE